MSLSNCLFVILALFTMLAGATAAPDAVDLSRAVVVTPPGLLKPESKAVEMLLDEVEKRTQLRWPRAAKWPEDGTPVIAVGPATSLQQFGGKYAAELGAEKEVPGREGYRLQVRTDRTAPAVLVVGSDARGVLFGVGGLLRALRMDRGRVGLPTNTRVATAPKYPIRGHQLGFRPKTNSYDGWDVRQWEQYFRDLTVFGANSIELIPPRSDDDRDSPHFPLPPMEMMVRMSRLADDYGLDVWVWYPALDPDYADPKWVDFALKEWEEVYKRLPRLDAIFVPGGDPGHTQPKYLFGLMEKQAALLRRYHPKAQMWVAPQGFNREWMDEFYGLMRAEPAWLTGIVFGPQVRTSAPELRAAIPARYPIRHYPDITHTLHCQYPVENWDLAFAATEGREPINPRPLAEAQIFRATQPSTAGFITYSEGCNDDVNKCVWSALGWDPDADVTQVLREYSRYYLGERYADPFAQGLLALERNWQGPLLGNEGVTTTLRQFQALERAARPQERANWRFQQALYRAYYDAYLRRRLLQETALEEQALDALRRAPQVGSVAAMREAEAVLARAESEPVGADLRSRVFELAEALFQSVRMQLSVPRYQAISQDRGANLDAIDRPLNNRAWLTARFAALRALPSEPERQAGLREILDWTNPGPGGYYDELGNPARSRHVVRGPGLGQDPAFKESLRVSFASVPGGRLSWARHSESLYDAPLRMHYTGLDPEARYRLRIVYSGETNRRKIRLVAGDGIEIHPLRDRESPPQPVEFDLPAEATAGGELRLAWYGEPGLGGNGRNTQVSEVWLLRRD